MKSHSNVHAISDKEIAKLVSEVDHMATLVGDGFEPLAGKAIARLVKLTAKRRSVAPEIVRLTRQYGVGSPSAPLAKVEEHLATADRIRPLVAHVEGLRKVLVDVLLSLEDQAWGGLAANYGMLRAEARRNAVLANAIQPIRDALRTNRGASAASSGKGKKPAPATPNAPAPPPQGTAAAPPVTHNTTQ